MALDKVPLLEKHIILKKKDYIDAEAALNLQLKNGEIDENLHIPPLEN